MVEQESGARAVVVEWTVSRTAAPHAHSDPHSEQDRLRALGDYQVLDTPPEKPFDRLAALAARLLGCSHAAVAIVDADRIWFKARHGLTEVTQVERQPGLCDTTIDQDRPHIVRDTANDPAARNNSLVTGETGIRFYAGTPLTSPQGHRLGTLCAMDTRPGDVTEEDLTTLTDLARVVMDELELRLSALVTLREERRLRERAEHLAATLQRTLLPPSLPRVPGMELASHYHAASPSQVTGDFYDVLPLGDGRWAFFLGDVTGQGPKAATVASLARYTLRTSALHTADPLRVLHELNAALLMNQNVSQHCTVLFGVLKPELSGGFDIAVAGGGHPPALRVTTGSGTVEEIWPEGGMLVGALPDASFVSRRLHLGEGQTLLLYTDGIIEARPGGEFFGEQRLRTTLASNPRPHAQAQIDKLVTTLQTFDPAPTDDVALLALAVPPTSR